MSKKLEPLDTEKLEGEHIEIELKPSKVCKHFFEYVTATEVKCRTCHVGFYVSMKDRLLNGHLYFGDELVI